MNPKLRIITEIFVNEEIGDFRNDYDFMEKKRFCRRSDTFLIIYEILSDFSLLEHYYDKKGYTCFGLYDM
jgi:hypothetical protein